MPPTDQNNLPIIIVHLKTNINNDKPCLELRKIIFDMDLIKTLVDACMTDKPVLIFPTTKNKLLFSNSLVEKGIMFRDKTGKLVFSF